MNSYFSSEPALSLASGVLRVTPSPSSTVRDLLQRTEEMGAHLPTAQIRGVLIDMRRLVHIGPTEQVLLSHHCGQHLSGTRVAVLVPQRTGLGQRAARALGLDMRSFEEEAEALEWLVEED